MTSSTDTDKAKVGSVGAKEYRYTGNHPQDFEADGKVIMAGPGDMVKLTSEELENYQELFDNGLLLETGGK